MAQPEINDLAGVADSSGRQSRSRCSVVRVHQLVQFHVRSSQAGLLCGRACVPELLVRPQDEDEVTGSVD